MPDARNYVGMKILDPNGAEQFGLGLQPDGGISMGFDVRPGVGNPGNRERLNLGVTPTGQGWIRYLDNDTRARLWVMLDASNRPVAQYFDWPDDQRIVVREVGFGGERTSEIAR